MDVIEGSVNESEQSSEEDELVETPCVVEVIERRVVEDSVIYPAELDVANP